MISRTRRVKIIIVDPTSATQFRGISQFSYSYSTLLVLVITYLTLVFEQFDDFSRITNTRHSSHLKSRLPAVSENVSFERGDHLAPGVTHVVVGVVGSVRVIVS